MKRFCASVEFESELGLWTTTDGRLSGLRDDIPGLILMTKTLDELVREFQQIAPVLLTLNNVVADGEDYNLALEINCVADIQATEACPDNKARK